ncbi:YetF domain-containing protein [Nonomuraea sp. NPDC005983]|uniref:YetF domain-containing protein n=1 Tax=Nonomuraea sp. NPDC005983 TaxID=3155595 RepID=UPI0033B8CC78
MINDLLVSEVSFADKAVRTIAVYLAVALLLRLAGKRDLAQLNNFDLVVMLLISNVVQNAIIGPDNSLIGGLEGAVILVAFNAVVVRLAASVPWIGRLIEGQPTVLARDGHYLDRVLRRTGLRRADVDTSIQRQGGTHVSDTSLVTLEPGGSVLVRLRPEEVDATRGDVDDLRARLDRIERQLEALLERGAH